MKKIQCFLLVLTIAGMAFAVSAQQKGGNSIGDRLFPAISRVLTDDQRQSLQQIVLSQRAQLQPLEKELRASRQALLDQIASGTFDENLVRQDAEQSAKAESDLTVMFAKALSQMQPPLSAAQVQKLKSLQPGRFQDLSGDAGVAPQSHFKLPAQLPRDTNDLPVVQ